MSLHRQSTESQKFNRPKDTKFHRQDLEAWQPVIGAQNVFPFFFAFGVIFMCIGVVLLVASCSVSEVTIPYTHCIMEGTTTKCSDEVKRASFFMHYQTCKCRVSFNLSSPMEGKVFMYYGLTKFYQNHRDYIKSRDDYQLMGKNVSSLDIDCEPYKTIDIIVGNVTFKKNFAPCGTKANSIFNDTFKLFYLGDNDSEKMEVGLLKEGIAWNTDRYRKFGIPPNESWANTYKPLAWPKPAYERSPNAYRDDEDLQVWMRPAAFPNFRKLHRRINHKSDDKFKAGLPKGRYEFEVQYAYPVTSFGSEKHIILSTTSWMGGRNPTLGIGYLIVGFIQFVCGFMFFILHSRVLLQRTLEITVLDGKMTYRTSIGHIEPQPLSRSILKCFHVAVEDTIVETNATTEATTCTKTV